MESRLPVKKKQSLGKGGFRQLNSTTISPEEREVVEVWQKGDGEESIKLTLHFTEDEPPYCMVYYGENDPRPERIYERNLVSELVKREVIPE